MAEAESGDTSPTRTRSHERLQRSNSFQRFRQMEKDAEKQKAEQDKPRRPSGAASSTAGSQRVKAALHKNSLQFLLSRIAADDPALGVCDLSGNGSFVGLTQPQKVRAVNVIGMGSGLHTLKLNNLNMENTQAAAVAMLLRGTHKLQCFALEGNNFTEVGVLQIAKALDKHPYMQEVRALPVPAPAPCHVASRDHLRVSPSRDHLRRRPRLTV